MAQKIYPLWRSGIKGRSVNATAERRVNLYGEAPADGGDKSPLVLYPRPGLVRTYYKGAQTSDSTWGGPIRGVVWQAGLSASPINGVVFAAQGAGVRVALTLERFLTGDPFLLTSSGPVQMAALGNQTIAVDGVTGYYLTNSTTMQQEGVTDFPRASSIAVLAQRYIVPDPAYTGRFRWSDVGNALSWPALNFATAESAEDPLLLVFATRGELLLFGSSTIEFWQPTGTSAVFQVVGGATIEWGLGAFDTVRSVAGACMFVGKAGGQGQPQVVMLNGYSPQVVSTPDIEYNIAQEIAAGAVPCATVVTLSGHTWYVLNLKTTSFAYDVSNGMWAEWQTDGARWCGQYTFTYRGLTFVTDYRDGRIYLFDANRWLDDTTPIWRTLQTRHVFGNLNPLTISRLQLDVETGVGLNAGQGSNPQVMMQVSKDNGHTYGAEMWRTIYPQGGYRKTVSWNALGQADDFTFRFMTSDPVKLVLLNGAIEASQ